MQPELIQAMSDIFLVHSDSGAISDEDDASYQLAGNMKKEFNITESLLGDKLSLLTDQLSDIAAQMYVSSLQSDWSFKKDIVTPKHKEIVENNMKSDINIIGVSSFGFGGSNGHILLKKSDNVKSIHSIHYEKRKEYYVLKRQIKDVDNIYNQMSGIINTENFEIEEIDQNRLHFNTLVNEIGVNNKYDIPLIHQDLISLALDSDFLGFLSYNRLL
jgi:hypothetical protein